MVAKIIGAKQLQRALVKVLQSVGNMTLITSRLEVDMTKFAHVVTGYMKSTIYHKRNIAGASAPYAGYEADRGGTHDYAQRAIDVFPVEDYFDEVVRPF